MNGTQVFSLVSPFLYGVRENGHLRSSAFPLGGGLLATVSHPLEDPDKITLVSSLGKEFPAKVLGWDNRYDFALLSAVGLDETPSWGELGELKPGAPVFSLGFDKHGPRIHGGLVAQIRDRQELPMGGVLTPWVEVDGVLSSTMSGGPLSDLAGKILGMNSLVPHGKGMTLPVALLRSLAQQIQTQGTAKPAFLGVVTVEGKTGAGEPALVVTEVKENTPAFLGGLLSGDLLVSLGARRLDHPAKLYQVLRSLIAGETVEALLHRGGREMRLSLVLGER